MENTEPGSAALVAVGRHGGKIPCRLHCPLQEISTHLPVLKQAFAATNEAHKQYVRQQAITLERREDVWKQERKEVEEIAHSLHF